MEGSSAWDVVRIAMPAAVAIVLLASQSLSIGRDTIGSNGKRLRRVRGNGPVSQDVLDGGCQRTGSGHWCIAGGSRQALPQLLVATSSISASWRSVRRRPLALAVASSVDRHSALQHGA